MCVPPLMASSGVLPAIQNISSTGEILCMHTIEFISPTVPPRCQCKESLHIHLYVYNNSDSLHTQM